MRLLLENVLRHIGTGLNIPLELLMKDFSKTNYSSARAALIEAWRFFNGRRSWIINYWANDLMNKARTGVPVDLEFGYELSETQKITIICHEVYLPKPKRSISGPGGIECSYDFQGSKEQTLGKMMTVILINNEEVY